ncbi:MAG: hypothetical protein EZS28_002622 [Streblomastix strix]|uniref:Uncharacterized protein n=1 Tax=Streblomastix strix TaxID=222440 RepID=A0A5J4X5E1_9EUKA|nr:MAG: hypothetical protein EZS28_002622 [Streblomastix strix]
MDSRNKFGILQEVLIPISVAEVWNGHISTLQAGTTKALILKKSITLERHASVALYQAIFAVTSVSTQFFTEIVSCTISQTRFFNPLGIRQLVLIQTFKSAVHTSYVIYFYLANGTVGLTYANANALGLILNLILRSPKIPLGQSVKTENINKSSKSTEILNLSGIKQGKFVQIPTAFSISLIAIYITLAEMNVSVVISFYKLPSVVLLR